MFINYYSQCSATCGIGRQERLFDCMKPNIILIAHIGNTNISNELNNEIVPSAKIIEDNNIKDVYNVGENDEPSSSGKEKLECGRKPLEVRSCGDGSPCPGDGAKEICLRDSSQFCQLPVLHQYCHIPKYRILCCHTCANVLPTD